MKRRLLLDLAALCATIIVALGLRTFVFAIYAIPSESMLPALMVGDRILVERWPYAPLPWRERSHPVLPARGVMVLFRAPPAYRQDYLKRVVGLPGDRVAIRNGRLIINGQPVPRWRIADLVVPPAPHSPCRPVSGFAIARDPDGGCRTPRYREVIDGHLIDVLDAGRTDGDTFGPVTVPAAHLFLLGDNRDRSADSRFPAEGGGAIGMVPLDALIGRPTVILYSADGSARLASPSSWWGALRPGRSGKRL